jgi:hypothetical protein
MTDTCTCPTKVAIPLPPEHINKGRYEWLGARPVGSPNRRGEGIYRLHNTSYWSSFSIDDLVEVRRFRDRLEVVRLKQRGPRTSYFISWQPPSTELLIDAHYAVWRDTGAWIEPLCDHRAVMSLEEETPRARPTWSELEQLKRLGLLAYALPTALTCDEPGDPDLFGHLQGMASKSLAVRSLG